MADLSKIRDGIAANITKHIRTLRASAEIPDNPNPPIAVVQLQTVDFDGAFANGLTTYNFTVTVIVGRAAERIHQRTLDALMASSGKQSLKSAVELDRTLGGNAYDTKVTGVSNFGSIQLNDNTYLAADFSVAVYAN